MRSFCFKRGRLKRGTLKIYGNPRYKRPRLKRGTLKIYWNPRYKRPRLKRGALKIYWNPRYKRPRLKRGTLNLLESPLQASTLEKGYFKSIGIPATSVHACSFKPEALRQLILKRAFEGKLVPQET